MRNRCWAVWGQAHVSATATQCSRLSAIIWLGGLVGLWFGHDLPLEMGTVSGSGNPAVVGRALLAGEFNQTLSIGDPAPSWEQLPRTDGKTSSLADFADCDAVVLVFSCVSCPTARDYEQRIAGLMARYEEAAESRGRVGWVVACVNRVPEDRLDALAQHVQNQQLPFPFVSDESQELAKQYGAIFTPEFYVLDRERRVAYMGAFDDQTDPAAVKEHYVANAINAVLKGEQPAVTETIARGCRVRYARDRREKPTKP